MITELNAGDIISIYTDYQDCTGYEGKVILLEKVKQGDSFYLTNEKLIPSDKKQYDDIDQARIIRYSRLNTFLKGNTAKNPRPHCARLYKNLSKCRKGKLTEHKVMSDIINMYRKKYKNSTDTVNTLLKEYDNDYIIRYIQQDQKNWRPSIFSYERWKVQFIEDYTGWKVDWTTNRNIRILKCVNPNERQRRSQLAEFTTYDGGKPSRQYDRITDIYNYNKLKEKELNKQASMISDDNMEAY